MHTMLLLLAMIATTIITTVPRAQTAIVGQRIPVSPGRRHDKRRVV